MENAIFIDLDNTLLYQCPWPESAQMKALVTEKTSAHSLSRLGMEEVRKLLQKPDGCTMLRSTVMVVTPRPGAQQFLEGLKAHTKNLFIMTKGTVKHQSKVLKEAGLDGYFSGFFGRDSKLYPNIPASLLVDNNHSRDRTTVWKMALLGMVTSERPGTMEYSDIVNAKYVEVSAFQNRPEDERLDKYLEQTISKLKNLPSFVVSSWLGKIKKNT